MYLWWREKGLLTVHGIDYMVYREGLTSGAFILELDGTVLARAEKPSAFHRAFLIEHAGKQYTLRAKSAFRRAFLLLDGSEKSERYSRKGSLRAEQQWSSRKNCLFQRKCSSSGLPSFYGSETRIPLRSH